MSRTGPLLVGYTLTLFVSAFLLMMVQPLVGKMIVPLLGGFPSVWNTCMVFFQAMLLAGYAYAHWSTQYLGVRKQAALHLVVLLVPLAVLTPLGVYKSLVPAGEDNPIPGLLLMLLTSVGLPFFAVSTTAPLLQRWFASTGHPDAKDPYFLYAASNAGSMLGLIGYLVGVEPYLRLWQQQWGWSIGYGLLALLIAGCAVLLWQSAPAAATSAKGSDKSAPPPDPTAVQSADRFRLFARDLAGTSLDAPSLAHQRDPSWGRIVRWIGLAAVPSSLMLGVTTYITTDIAAIAGLWLLPLILYFLSFILVFSRLPAIVHKAFVLALPVLILLLIFVMISKTKIGIAMWATILLHLGVLFVVAMVCHGELARTRPPAKHLTAFFLWMSVGGVLGGLFNALFAPVVFRSLWEYPIAMALAGFLLPRLDEDKKESTTSLVYDFALPVGLAILAMEFFNGFRLFTLLSDKFGLGIPGYVSQGIAWLASKTGLEYGKMRSIVSFAPPVVLCYLFVERPLRFGLGLTVLLAASVLPEFVNKENVFHDRSFFGVLSVREYPEANYPHRDVDGGESDVEVLEHRLTHGNILHGTQFLDDDYRTVPLTYYHPSGPVGQLMSQKRFDGKGVDVAVVGLGTGSMAAYAREGRSVTFYEIDRLVKSISFDPPKAGRKDQYFTYVQDAKARGATVDIVLGDGRLSLERETERMFDVMIIDAFSSDAIPVHLMTVEALEIYLKRLKPGGIVAFHTSNRYLTLEPEVGNIAAACKCVALRQHDYARYPRGNGPTSNGLFEVSGAGEEPAGISSSSWVLVARAAADFGTLPDLEKTMVDSDGEETTSKVWKEQPPVVGQPPWSDDFSNLLRAFSWTSK